MSFFSLVRNVFGPLARCEVNHAQTEGMEQEEEEQEEEEDDELTIAFEVLDLAKVLFQRRLEAIEESEKGKGTDASVENPTTRHVKERLGDCHDLLAELSLEQER